MYGKVNKKEMLVKLMNKETDGIIMGVCDEEKEIKGQEEKEENRVTSYLPRTNANVTGIWKLKEGREKGKNTTINCMKQKRRENKEEDKKRTVAENNATIPIPPNTVDPTQKSNTVISPTITTNTDDPTQESNTIISSTIANTTHINTTTVTNPHHTENNTAIPPTITNTAHTDTTTVTNPQHTENTSINQPNTVLQDAKKEEKKDNDKQAENIEEQEDILNRMGASEFYEIGHKYPNLLQRELQKLPIQNVVPWKVTMKQLHQNNLQINSTEN